MVHADCRDHMRTMDADSVDAIVTDPPYGLSFMGKGWDKGVPGVEFWQEASRVLKPGAHLLAFGGDRTVHRLACAIEDAGFEIRTQIVWLYGQGFPKSRNVTADLDAMIPAESRCSCALRSTQTVPDSLDDYQDRRHSGDALLPAVSGGAPDVAPSPADVHARSRADQHSDVPASSPASTSLDEGIGRLSNASSAHPVSRPLADSQGIGSTPFGTPSNTSPDDSTAKRKTARRISGSSRSGGDSASSSSKTPTGVHPHIPHCTTCGGAIVPQGLGTALKPAFEPIIVARKPIAEKTVAANVLMHGTGALNIDACRIGCAGGTTGATAGPSNGIYGHGLNGKPGQPVVGLGRWPANVCLDETAAALVGDESRFFYTAKASRSERNAGLAGMPERAAGSLNMRTDSHSVRNGMNTKPASNGHPTVKPISLMRWLIRLVTPEGGLVLDPFAGSGSTGCAAALEGREFIGIEREAEYVEIAEKRIAWWSGQPRQRELIGGLL